MKWISIAIILLVVLSAAWFFIQSDFGAQMRSGIPPESIQSDSEIEELDTMNEVGEDVAKLNETERSGNDTQVSETEADAKVEEMPEKPSEVSGNEQEKDMTDISSTNAMVSTANSMPADTGARATLMLGGGCFWCVEADLEKLQGVLSAVSGYAGGTTENPTYSDYSKGGHREVVEVTYNPTVVSYREILIYAIKHMDPTDADGSFFDRGVQYAPAIYFENTEEKITAEETVAAINELNVYDKPLALVVEKRPKFWSAEDYHQDYYKGTLSALKYKYYRNGSGRDTFIKKYWGDDTGPTLPNETTPFDVSAWKGFQNPSDAELQSLLTNIQYTVTQKKGTERAFDNEYWDNKEAGIYVDVISGEPLYSSTDKFDSGTGWPSFTKGIYPDAVTEHADYKLIVKRIEVRSQFADSHLGHVFNDAPADLGGIRHCINSAALRFVPKANMQAEGYGQFLGLFN